MMETDLDVQVTCKEENEAVHLEGIQLNVHV